MIEVNNLVKRYGDHTAVDHLSFKIEKGKIYGFLGPNGAGKSTTMNMITGYIASTEGTVTIDGHDILDEPEQAKKCIGYLPEMPPLYFDMTVGEYMNFVADLKKIPKDQKKSMVEEVMEMVKITDMKNRLIKNLSKGYRQRVGLAQAILGYPEVIILDEPTVGLDPKQIIEIRDLIKSLKKKHTVILSSHILSEVSAVCDYVLIISHGKLVATTFTYVDETGATIEATKSWVINWSKVADASWFAIPKIMPVKWVFDAKAIVPICIMFVVTAVETVGDISGITEGGLGREATDKELSGGVMCDGLGSSLAAVFGVLPNTSG